jgi:hypothetical protein
VEDLFSLESAKAIENKCARVLAVNAPPERDVSDIRHYVKSRVLFPKRHSGFDESNFVRRRSPTGDEPPSFNTISTCAWGDRLAALRRELSRGDQRAVSGSFPSSKRLIQPKREFLSK